MDSFIRLLSILILSLLIGEGIADPAIAERSPPIRGCSIGVIRYDDIPTDNANNPAFVQTSTDTVFFKYDTPILDASEHELVAMEFAGRYEKDTQGHWWIVSRDGKPLSRMTKMYGHHFSNTLPATRTFEYEYNATDYAAALQQVRGNSKLQEEAMNWATKAKATFRERQPAHGTLEQRAAYRCGPDYDCEDASGCKLFGGDLCDVCSSGKCYDNGLPDGC